jgi:hypothetical protein
MDRCGTDVHGDSTLHSCSSKTCRFASVATLIIIITIALMSGPFLHCFGHGHDKIEVAHPLLRSPHDTNSITGIGGGKDTMRIRIAKQGTATCPEIL